MTIPIQYTLWTQGIYDIDTSTHVSESWPELIQRFCTHLRTPDKFSAPGFGPYRLEPSTTPCLRHSDGVLRSGPHRCDQSVAQMTLLVFDADAITDPAQVERCDQALNDVAHLWYSSHSHSPPGKHAYRLIIPMSRPVPPQQWPLLRRLVLDQYAIPADPKQCSGKSHFYFVPSCPPGATPQTWSAGAHPLDPLDYISVQNIPTRRVLPVEWEPPPEPEGTVDLVPLRQRLQERASYLKRSGDKRRGQLLQRVLDGEALAQHGARDTSLFTAAGMVSWVLPEQPVSVLVHLLKPSWSVMVREGSSVTEKALVRGVTSAMHTPAMRAAENEDLLARLRREKENTTRT